jgi:hypothetical protein
MSRVKHSGLRVAGLAILVTALSALSLTTLADHGATLVTIAIGLA